MKTQIESSGLMAGSNLLYFDPDKLPELAHELKGIAKGNCTLQDMEIASTLYKELSYCETCLPCDTCAAGILGAIFYAGQIMGVRAERAKQAAKKERSAKK